MHWWMLVRDTKHQEDQMGTGRSYSYQEKIYSLLVLFF